MQRKWHFRQFRAGDTLNDPIQRALFSQESATSDSAAALVREAIQNSLDAKSDSADCVTVTFTLHTGATAPSRAEFRQLLDALPPHLEAEYSGLDNAPAGSSSVPLLVIEDFGTKGLIGDENSWDPAQIQGNSFYLFFRALGRSGKSGEARGRWGVGKFVFPLASRANSWFGYTLAEGSQTGLLMGRCVLRTHVIDGLTWHPDGTWGASRPQDGHILPLRDDESDFSQAIKALRVSRRTGTGLSVIIPWVRDEIRPGAITASVLREYFVPVLRGDLKVVIREGTELDADVDRETSVDLVSRINDRGLADLVALALQEAKIRETHLTVLEDATADGVPTWRNELVPDAVREDLNARLDEGEPIMLRVPFQIRRKTGGPESTHVDVLLKHFEEGGASSPLLVREGITIPEAKTRRVQGVSILVLIDDTPIASLVGDAENPAHTQLQSTLLKDKYKQGNRVITFLRELGANIIQSLAGADDKEDRSFLATYFPAGDEGSAQTKRAGRKRGKVSPLPAPPTRKPPRYQVRSSAGGFVVTNGKDSEAQLKELLI